MKNKITKMVITDLQLNKFIELYEKEFGILLSRTDAIQSFRSLITLTEIMYGKDNQVQK